MAAAFAKIELDAQVMDCAFHPLELVLAIGQVDGTLASFKLSHNLDGDDDEFVSAESGWTSDVHADSCRCVAHLASGDGVLSASKDGSLVVSDVRDGQEMFHIEDAHDGSEPSRVFCSAAGCVASGDDEGVVKMWDLRQTKQVAQYNDHTDFISDFAHHGRDDCLVSTSGDGTVCVFDLKKGKVRARSEDDADDEYLSCQVMKRGKKLVAGSQQGILSIFSWGHFADCSDRYPGHPNSIDALVKFDDDTLLTGSGDGGIRIVSVLPNKLVGLLGVHEDDEPVERMAMSADSLLLASTSHDSVLKVWSLKCLQEDEESDEDADDDEEQGKPSTAKRKSSKKSLKSGDSKKTKMQSKATDSSRQASFFADMLDS